MIRRLLTVRHFLVLVTIQCVLPRVALRAQDVFYYRDGQKVPLVTQPTKHYVLLQPGTEKKRVEAFLRPKGAVLRKFEELKPLNTITLFQEEPERRPRWAIIDNVTPDGNPLADKPFVDDILYSAPFLLTQNRKEVGLSHLFYVKLRERADRAALMELAKQHNVDVLGSNKFMPLWHTLACTKASRGNSMEMANTFFESDLFDIVEPDFLVNFQIQSANDQHFNQQWGFDNTGQHCGTVGPDINACDAWNVTTGNRRTVVAVLDHGIELGHPDMPNVSPLSFDTVSGTFPSRVRGSHGTACAGIVGAARNNSNLGVAGIAPDVTLMSISNSLFIAPNVAQELANGINWAWLNGADVISNSWGHNGLASALIDDAIRFALTRGRRGLGTVVVFAAGNDNGAVIYPANSHPEILVVGAMSPDGERKNPSSCDGEWWWGSNFGNEIDVVAPGVLVPTTDRQGAAGYDSGDYTLTFNGTSSACPHIAGLAALVFSVNPGLTQQQAVEIIETTAQKVGGYNYQPTLGRLNGTWHNEMGYGLADAFGAVTQALVSAAPARVQDSRPIASSADSNPGAVYRSLAERIEQTSNSKAIGFTVRGDLSFEDDGRIRIKFARDAFALVAATSIDPNYIFPYEPGEDPSGRNSKFAVKLKRNSKVELHVGQLTHTFRLSSDERQFYVDEKEQKLIYIDMIKKREPAKAFCPYECRKFVYVVDVYCCGNGFTQAGYGYVTCSSEWCDRPRCCHD